ncbi:MSMEG_6728 family protein [Catenuloplanes sp. NPDC051500]|uniref:MSMEG_6728 family protein n=1 Tax=Catenuloplanes sp. NPDC051500 TaxID=3363959 RepID=UPI0037A61C90
MQTFLPYASFLESARVLDDKRLGKQRAETLQVLRGLTRVKYGWRNHPAVKMWHGYPEALVRYGLDMCAVWEERGFADTVAATLIEDYAAYRGESAENVTIRTQQQLERIIAVPPWLGNEEFHLSHRSSLLAKDPDFYGPVFGDIPADLPYVWPVPA